MSTTQTLADVRIEGARCSHCIEEFPLSVPIETFWTPASQWIVVVECPKCKRCTPFRLEEK